MSKLGKELNSRQYWAESSMDYVSKLPGSYHSHRLNVIRALIPTTLFGPDINVFDFGCGDAVLFPWFLEIGATISGVDISSEMISLAKKD